MLSWKKISVIAKLSKFLKLAQQPSTAALGIVLLQTTSEELACPREDLSVARKDELNKLLLAEVPVVLGILNSKLTIVRFIAFSKSFYFAQQLCVCQPTNPIQFKMSLKTVSSGFKLSFK